MIHRCLILLAAMSMLAPAAMADDVFYQVKVADLALEDSLPSPPAKAGWWRRERARAMRPYVVLEAPGEAYLDLNGDDPEVDETVWGPLELTSQSIVLASGPPGRDLTGRLFSPQADWNGMASVRFTISADRASPKAREAFHAAQRAHYNLLARVGLPGGAWFRHRARMAAIALSGDASGAAQLAARSVNRPSELADTFELFSGGRAISENLQLDRALGVAASGEPSVDIGSLAGITIQEIKWPTAVEGERPEADPLAWFIPADQHAVFFPSFQALVDMADEAERQGELVMRLMGSRADDVQIKDRYERQLCLPLSTAARLLGPRVVRSVALTGSDPYFATGTDVAMMFEANDSAVLKALVQARVALAAQAIPAAQPQDGEVEGVSYTGYCSPDRAVCSYVAEIQDAVVVTNSLVQLKRLASVAKGETAPLAVLDEYTFFRRRYPRSDQEETALVFLSDAAIRRWCSPRWRIANSRRTRAAGALAELQAQSLDTLAGGEAAGPVQADFALAELGTVSLSATGVASSAYGTLDFLTPIVELDLQKVTRAEARAYERWRDGYQQRWRWSFDPIALRLGVRPERLSADLTVMPLIWGSEYQWLVNLTRGGVLSERANDVHDALVHFALAVDPGNSQFRSIAEYVFNRGGQGDALAWMGASIGIYIDDDPIWQEISGMDFAERQKFLSANVHRLPLAIHFDVEDENIAGPALLNLDSFLKRWLAPEPKTEILEHQGHSYSRISCSGKPTGLLQLPHVYYTLFHDGLVVSLNERVIQRALERQAVRKAAQVARGDSRQGQAWLASSVGLQADPRLFGMFGGLFGGDYQAQMQVRAWENLPILNEWKRRYPDIDPVELHARFWQTRLTCPGGGQYVWNDQWQTMESTVYGHPGQPKPGPNRPAFIESLVGANLGLTFEEQGLRARAVLNRKARE